MRSNPFICCWIQVAKILLSISPSLCLRNIVDFLLLWCFHLPLESEKYWPHRTSYELFPLLLYEWVWVLVFFLLLIDSPMKSCGPGLFFFVGQFWTIVFTSIDLFRLLICTFPGIGPSHLGCLIKFIYDITWQTFHLVCFWQFEPTLLFSQSRFVN